MTRPQAFLLAILVIVVATILAVLFHRPRTYRPPPRVTMFDTEAPTRPPAIEWREPDGF